MSKTLLVLAASAYQAFLVLVVMVGLPGMTVKRNCCAMNPGLTVCLSMLCRGCRYRLSSTAVVGLGTIAGWGLVAVAWQVTLGAADIRLSVPETLWLISLVTVGTILSFIPGGVGVADLLTVEAFMAVGIEQVVAQTGALLLVILVVLALFAFLLFHFFPAWLAIALCGHGATCKKRLEMPAVVYAAGAIAAGVLFTNFTLPGGAGYYFSNVSFFVSLPILLAAFSGWFNNQSRLNSPLLGGGRLIVMAAFVAVWVGAEGVYLRTRTNVPEANNPVVKHLVDIRKRSEIGQILSASDVLLKDNPLERCTARPFLYPAVSERPWVNILVVNDGCRFEWYGFDDYNVGPSQTRVVPGPALGGLPIVPADSVRWSHKGRP